MLYPGYTSIIGLHAGSLTPGSVKSTKQQAHILYCKNRPNGHLRLKNEYFNLNTPTYTLRLLLFINVIFASF